MTPFLPRTGGLLLLCLVAACTGSPREPAEGGARRPGAAPAASPKVEAARTVPAPPASPAKAPPAPAKAASEATAPARPAPVSPSPARPAPAAPAPAASAKPAPAQPRPAAAPLDLDSLEQKLRQTDAIGVMTKLSIKNQVDDLVAQFRAYHDGRRPPTLQQLRSPFELLLMKLMSLLQDKDPPLAKALHESREAIWSLLSDRDKFRQHS